MQGMAVTLGEGRVQLGVRTADSGLHHRGSVGHRRLLVFSILDGEEVLKLPRECLKGWPLHGVLMPALHHDVIEG